MIRSFYLSAATVLLAVAATAAADYRLEPIPEGPPGDGLAKAIAAQLAPTGVAVIRGAKRRVCAVWLCRTWPVQAGFSPTAEVLYPFRPGQLIGVLHFARKGSDFRDQQLAKGFYTLRYAQLPVDGNHEGTSPTRDFLCLVQAQQDGSAAPLAEQQLNDLSAAAAMSEHPALLCLQRPQGNAANLPALQHDEDRDWWIARLPGMASVDGKTVLLPIDLVIVGQAEQ